MIRDLFTFPSHRQGAARMLAWLTAWVVMLVPFALLFAALYRPASEVHRTVTPAPLPSHHLGGGE